MSPRSRRSSLHWCRWSYPLDQGGHPSINGGHTSSINAVVRFIRRNRPLLSILRLTKGFINRKDSAIFQARMDNLSKFLVHELKRLISRYGCLIKVLKITALRWIKTIITKFCKPIGSKLYYWSLNVKEKIYFSSPLKALSSYENIMNSKFYD